MPEAATQWGAGRATAGVQLIRNGVDVTPAPPTAQERYEECLVWIQALEGAVRVFVDDEPHLLDKALGAMQVASDRVNQALERLVITKYEEDKT